MTSYAELNNRIKTARGRATTFSAGPGLTVTPAGTATWCARVRRNGWDTLVRLGAFADLSLKAARAAAADLRGEQNKSRPAMLHGLH